jgi:SAM-dependent MidA family methyltransferase
MSQYPEEHDPHGGLYQFIVKVKISPFGDFVAQVHLSVVHGEFLAIHCPSAAVDYVNGPA